jgi:hypothetical protein
MKRDIRACSRSELDAINLEIARYKAMRSGTKQSDVPTQPEGEETASIPVESREEKQGSNNLTVLSKVEQWTSKVEQLDLF